MKKINEKQFIIIISVPILLILSYMVYSTFNKTDNNIIVDNNNQSAIILPDVDEIELNKSKISIYEQLANEKTVKTENEDLFSFSNKNSRDRVREEINNSSATSIDTERKEIKKENNIHQKKNINQSVEKKEIKKENNASKQQIQEIEPTQEIISSMTVYRQSSNNNSISEKKEQNYIPAILEKSQKIKHNSEVVFLLQQNAQINNISFQKLDILFGIAKFSGTRVEIIINMIQDKTGQKHPITLIGYNENYQRGIYYEDKVDQASNNAQRGSVRRILSSNQATSIAGNTADDLLSRERGEINVNEGYKMFFKID